MPTSNELIHNGLLNLFSGVGTQRHLTGYSDYLPNSRVLSWVEMEELYASGSWLHRAAVDMKPDAAVHLPLEKLSDEAQQILADYNLVQINQQLDRWSILYGGCLLVHTIEGFNIVEAPRASPDNPFNPKLYKLSDFGYITKIGNPELGTEIKASSVYKLNGLPIPYSLRASNRGYGDTIYSKVNDPIKEFTHADACLSQVLARHSILTYGIEGLADLIMGGQLSDVKRLISESLSTLSTHNALVYDSATTSANFISQNLTHLDKLLVLKFDQCAAAMGVTSEALWGFRKAGTSGLAGNNGDSGWSTIIKQHQLTRYIPVLDWAVKKIEPSISIKKEFMNIFNPEKEVGQESLEKINEK
jgi:hypothetical protein